MQKNIGVCAVVLAAGFSTRMGRPKALLDWHGTTFLAHICRTLAAAEVPRIIVVTSATNAKACDAAVMQASAECGSHSPLWRSADSIATEWPRADCPQQNRRTECGSHLPQDVSLPAAPCSSARGHSASAARNEQSATAMSLPSKIICVINPRPEDGMLSSIRCGLDALGDPRMHLMLCLVDHPGVQVATYRTLAAHATADTIIVPTHAGRRGHPTIFGADFMEELRHGACPDGARSVVRTHPDALRQIAVDDPCVLTDIDTPADYAAAVSNL